METIEDPEPAPAQCPLRPVRTYGPSVVAVSRAQRAPLAPADWIVYEWTPYLYRFEGATHLRIGSHILDSLVEGVFPVQFDNQLGLTSLTPYRHGIPLAPPVHLEVIASKFTSPDHSLAFLQATLADLFTRHSTIPFVTSAMTERMVRESPAPPNLLFVFHFLRHHYREFIQAVQAILGRPHQRLSDIEEQVRPHEVRHINRESMIRMLQGVPSSAPAATLNAHTLSPLQRLRPELIWQRRPEETIDTPENRYVLHICRRVLDTIRDIERTGWYRASVPARDRHHIDAVSEALTMLTVDRRFVALGPMTVIPSQSRVLQRKDGYRELGVLWQQILRSRQPIFERMQSAIDLRNVADLYEFWVLFELLDRIGEITGVEPIVSNTQGPFGEPGRGQTFTFAGHGVLFYNHGRRGYSKIALRPDYLWEPTDGQWVAFDAKFRMVKPAEEMDEETGEVSSSGVARSKDDDWQKMHTYRDGLTRVRAAVVLYPGQERKFRDTTGIHRDIDVADLLTGDINGIGAIPMSPSGVTMKVERNNG